MADTTILLRTAGSWVEKTPDVCGGRARIRRMRMAVWLLVYARDQLGESDQQLLDSYPDSLTPADLEAAWLYYEHHREEIDHDIYENTVEALEL